MKGFRDEVLGVSEMGPIQAWATVQSIIEDREAMNERTQFLEEFGILTGSFDTGNMTEEDYRRIKAEVQNGC